MTIEKLIKYCIQYLELDADNDVTRMDMSEIAQIDTFTEYINNIENSIYMGLSRYSSSNVLEPKTMTVIGAVANLKVEQQIPERDSNGYVKYDYTGGVVYKTVYKNPVNKILDVYAVELVDGEMDYSNIHTNIEYYMLGDKIVIKKPKTNYVYQVVYRPKIFDLEHYMSANDTNIYNIELNDLGVTDEMAINLKYFVFSDLKLEENPNVANTNKNYFETYLESLKDTSVYFNQTEMPNRANYDVYSDDAVTESKEWRDIYGD